MTIRKGKDPAILFYPGDWAMGTLLLSRAHKGAYMDLLVTQFNNGHISLDDIKGILNGDFESLWPKLSTKFVQDGEGNYYNERWEHEMLRRKKFTDSRKENFSSRIYVKHTEKATPPPPPPPPPDQQKQTERKFIPPSMEDVIQYFKENGYTTESAIKAFNYYSAGNWKDSEGKPVKAWKQKMIGVWFKPENKLPQESPKKLSTAFKAMT